MAELWTQLMFSFSYKEREKGDRGGEREGERERKGGGGGDLKVLTIDTLYIARYNVQYNGQVVSHLDSTAEFGVSHCQLLLHVRGKHLPQNLL